jgi:hypothetical protein
MLKKRADLLLQKKRRALTKNPEKTDKKKLVLKVSARENPDYQRHITKPV